MSGQCPFDGLEERRTPLTILTLTPNTSTGGQGISPKVFLGVAERDDALARAVP
jgi:hypothetical protein